MTITLTGPAALKDLKALPIGINQILPKNLGEIGKVSSYFSSAPSATKTRAIPIAQRHIQNS